MLARDYARVGANNSALLNDWNSAVGRLRSIGKDDCEYGGVAISDALRHNVQFFSERGEGNGLPLGRKGRLRGDFMQPCQAALSADGSVLAVADSGNNRVQLFDSKSKRLLSSIGRQGQIRPGRMEGPEGVAFVEGRREMIVADTGNDRLQVFHVGVLPELTDVKNTSASSSKANAEVADSRRQDGAVAAWARSQAQDDNRALESGQGSDGPRRGREAKKHVDRFVQGEETASGGLTDVDTDQAACLLVFNGWPDGMIKPRRTAGESTEAEGPLRQPCDVAYWRRKPKLPPSPLSTTDGMGSSDKGSLSSIATKVTFLSETEREDAVAMEQKRAREWLPQIPSWYKRFVHLNDCHDSGNNHGSIHDEESLRMQLLRPDMGGPTAAKHGSKNTLRHTEEGKHSFNPSGSVAMRRKYDGSVRTGKGAAALGVGAQDDREGFVGEPQAGAFVVRETGVAGELQLMFVASTQVEDSEAVAKEGTSGSSDVVSASEHIGSSDYSDSDGLDWMKRLASLQDPSSQLTRDEKYRVEDSANDPSSPPAFEVRSENIYVLKGNEGVKIGSSTYSCLLSLLRKFRGKGFFRLQDVTDTRGERGLVAVAERGGGRVRLLHFAPPLGPFYTAELTHVHSIEGLRRPTSVSFSADGDLVVVDEGAKQIIIYSQLSGTWALVHTFGPEQDTVACHQLSLSDKNLNKPANRMSSATGGDYDKLNHAQSTTADGDEHDNARSRGFQRANGQGEKKDIEKGGKDYVGCVQWGTCAPVVARFLPSMDEEGAERIVVGGSDGRVRLFGGPERRECGSFDTLRLENAMSIVEILGYRPSQSRLASGEGVPGRGTAADRLGTRLCEKFLATSACSRPACPYSHDQPWIDPGLASNEDACIMFRRGVIHAMTILYGQIFAWEWEGDLYRLFRDRSCLRVLIRRQDPMTRGVDGAEAVRDCLDEEHHVLNYAGFLDFATAVHEHVIGLRDWRARTTTTDRKTPSILTTKNSMTPPSTTFSRQKSSEHRINVGTNSDDNEAKRAQTRSDVTAGVMSAGGEPIYSKKCRSDKAPWLGWDFQEHGDSSSNGSDITAAIPATVRDDGRGYSGEESKGCFAGGELDRRSGDRELEEPTTNRTYGTKNDDGFVDERATSSNKLFAFQVDRVVRVLDELF